MAARRAPYGGRARLSFQITFIVLSLGALALPPLVVALSGTASLDATWTALRIAALEAFTLIFLNIVTGAFRPFFNRVFKARTVQRVHVATGLAGFSLALAHGITALVYGITGYSTGVVYIGPIVLVVLAAAIATALVRRRMRSTWRWIHRLNYLVFAAVLVHGLILGYDLKGEVLLKVLFIVYAAIVASGLVYRLAAMAKVRSSSAAEAG
jgi:DMSO/TMAO reductase YedYZ heme-binding membrane subunit